MSNNFKQYDFVYHKNDNVNGVVVSKVSDDDIASVFWEDGVYSKIYHINSPIIIVTGTPFNLQDAYLKYTDYLSNHDIVDKLDNLTYIELLDKLK